MVDHDESAILSGTSFGQFFIRFKCGVQFSETPGKQCRSRSAAHAGTGVAGVDARPVARKAERSRCSKVVAK